jgi:signal peptidase II
LRALWITFAIVVIDQVSKMLVKGISIPLLGLHIQGMRYGSSIPVFGDFFRLTYIENPGMAFGFDPGGKLFFSLFSIALSIGILYYLYHARNDWWGMRVALALILGGAIGNMIDRTFYSVIFEDGPLFHGKVVDFFDVDFFNIEIFGYALTRWPVFNVADAAVTTGIVMLLFVQHLRVKKELPAQAPHPQENPPSERPQQ